MLYELKVLQKKKVQQKLWASSILQPVSLVVHLPEVADVDQWSERMRQPFVEVYGEENFCRLWEGWGKAIRNYFTQRNGESLSFFFLILA